MRNRYLLGAAVIAASMFALTVRPAQAGYLNNRKVLSVRVTGTQHVVVTFDSSLTRRATCTTITSQMAFDASTAKGKALLSVASSALLANLSVRAEGTQQTDTATCTTVAEGSGVSNVYETLYNLTISR
jgi:hypothetical protein